MLGATHRLRNANDFRAVVRRGQRAGFATLVVHSLRAGGNDPAQVGFVVSKAVGPSVVRNRVKRQLRHLVAGHVAGLPAGLQLVVRALPAAADAGHDRLSTDINKAISRVVDNSGSER